MTAYIPRRLLPWCRWRSRSIGWESPGSWLTAVLVASGFSMTMASPSIDGGMPIKGRAL